MGLGSIRVGGFGWTNGSGFTLPLLVGMQREEETENRVTDG